MTKPCPSVAALFVVVFVSQLSILVYGQSTCTGTVNGKSYDLTPLSSSTQKVTWDFYEATYTPCKPMTCSTYNNVALCQKINGGSGGWPLGDFSSAEWKAGRSGNENGFQLYFTWQGSVKTTIEFICDPNAGVGTMAPGPNGAEPQFNNFFFDWKTNKACSGGGGG